MIVVTYKHVVIKKNILNFGKCINSNYLNNN